MAKKMSAKMQTKRASELAMGTAQILADDVSDLLNKLDRDTFCCIESIREIVATRMANTLNMLAEQFKARGM